MASASAKDARSVALWQKISEKQSLGVLMMAGKEYHSS
jgi:hypothetical protein